MAGRPPKEGIDFAGWSTDVFEDPKIDRLIDGQGVAGFVVYFYLCQMAYRLHGYYLPWTCTDAPTVARRIGGGVGSKTVEDTVGLCLRIGLFDNMLYVGHGILSSRGIQSRFLPALSKRRCKTIIADYWLLDTGDLSGVVFAPKNRL